MKAIFQDKNSLNFANWQSFGCFCYGKFMQIMMEQLEIRTLRVEEELIHVYDDDNRESWLKFTTIKAGMYMIYVDWHCRNGKKPTVFCKLWPGSWKEYEVCEIINVALDKDGEGGWVLELTRQSCWVEGCWVQWFDANEQYQRKLSLSLVTAKNIMPFVECFLGSYALEREQDLINLAIKIHVSQDGELID